MDSAAGTPDSLLLETGVCQAIAGLEVRLSKAARLDANVFNAAGLFLLMLGVGFENAHCRGAHSLERLGELVDMAAAVVRAGSAA
jgi:hypothetical protein